MITGSVEYDVYVLMRHKSFWQWIFPWLRPSYQIVLGQDFASAHNAAKQAELKTNATPGRAIGIAADALVCCEDKHHVVG